MNEDEILRQAQEEANKKRSTDQVSRLRRGMTAEEILAKAAPRWEGEYCKGCELPLKDRPCPFCEEKAKQDAALRARWMEALGGQKAWDEYTEARFVRTQFNHAAFLAAAEFRPTQNLLLYGPPGTGKSHLRAVACRPLVMRGMNVKTVFMQEELGQARGQMKIRDEVQTRIKSMVDARVLCIEDLGVEKPSEWVINEWYYPIIDSRYRLNRPGLIVTMNHSLEQLKTYWSKFDPYGRVVSRMTEMFRGRTYSLSGERDWRGT